MARVSLYEYGEEARRLVQARQYDAAIAVCHHILLRYPKHIRTYQILGEACLEKGELDEAADIFRRLLARADPENLTAFVGLGVILDERSQLAEAAWFTERAFELASSSDEIRNRLRRLYGKRDGAEPPRVKLNKAALARLYARGGQYRQAIDEFRRLLESEPDRLDLKVALADTLLRDGRREQALELGREILSVCPDCLKAILLVGMVLLEKGKTQEAEATLAAGRGLDPENRIAYGLFGDRSPLPVQTVYIPRLVDGTLVPTAGTVLEAEPAVPVAEGAVERPVEAPVGPVAEAQPAAISAGTVAPVVPLETAVEPVAAVQPAEAVSEIVVPAAAVDVPIEPMAAVQPAEPVAEVVAPAEPVELPIEPLATMQLAEAVSEIVVPAVTMDVPIEPIAAVQPAGPVAEVVAPAEPVELPIEPLATMQAAEAVAEVVVPAWPVEVPVEPALAVLPAETIAPAPAVEAQAADDRVEAVASTAPAALTVEPAAQVQLTEKTERVIEVAAATEPLSGPTIEVTPIAVVEHVDAPSMERMPQADVQGIAPEEPTEATAPALESEAKAAEPALVVPKSIAEQPVLPEREASAVDEPTLGVEAVTSEAQQLHAAIVAPLAESQEAIDRYRVHLEEKPKDEESRLGLARAYRDQEQVKLALDQYALLLRGKPRLLAQLVEDMESLVASRPDNLEAHELLADMYGRSGQLQKAVERYRWILQRLEQRSV